MKIFCWIIAKMMTSKFSYNRFFVGFFLLFETKSQRTTRSLRNENCKFFTKWMVERKVNIFWADFRNQRRNNVNFIAKNLINNFAAETGRSVGRSSVAAGCWRCGKNFLRPCNQFHDSKFDFLKSTVKKINTVVFIDYSHC